MWSKNLFREQNGDSQSFNYFHDGEGHSPCLKGSQITFIGWGGVVGFPTAGTDWNLCVKGVECVLLPPSGCPGTTTHQAGRKKWNQ